jgi:hypothetical protein
MADVRAFIWRQGKGRLILSLNPILLLKTYFYNIFSILALHIYLGVYFSVRFPYLNFVSSSFAPRVIYIILFFYFVSFMNIRWTVDIINSSMFNFVYTPAVSSLLV